jgi:L-malate glycosyltransferase
LRVTIIIDSLIHANAGTEHQLAMLLGGLADHCSVEVLTFRDSPWLVGNAARLGIRTGWFRIENFRSWLTCIEIARLYRHLRRTRPDVVHTFFPVANIVGVAVARAARVRTVFASRRDYGEWMSARYLRVTRIVNRFTDAIVTNSERVAALTQAKEGVPARKLVVIRNGIEASSFADVPTDPDLRSRLQIPPDARVVGIVANYRPMKRHETLILAAPFIRAHRRDVHFLLVGRNMTPEDIESRLKRMVEERGLRSCVHFSHATHDLREHLGLMDVGVNCSEGEGLSNAIIEYMAAGIPCVVAESGGNPDLVQNGVTGLTFALGRHEELAEAVGRVLDDRALASRLTTQAREAAGTLSREAMISRFTELYARVPTPMAARRAERVNP